MAYTFNSVYVPAAWLIDAEIKNSGHFGFSIGGKSFNGSPP